MKNKNDTLSEQNEQQRTKNTILLEQNEKQNAKMSEQNEQKQKILYCKNRMKNKKYYTVGTK
jgi:hypothetical protein